MNGHSTAATPWMSTNLVLAAGETVSLTLGVSSGTVYTLDVSATNPVAAHLKDNAGLVIGKALSAYGLTWTAAQDGSYFLDVVNGPEAGACRLGIYTNALPFYRLETDPVARPHFLANRWYEGSEFGYVHVPACRRGSTPHSYRLPVVQMAAGPGATNGPLVFLSGGPGSSAIHQPYLFAAFTNTCRVVLMNQRGTYLAQPDLFPISTDETVSELQERLGGPDGMDFHTVNTRENAADILDGMTALGHDSFNLWGTSYGTMLAQEVIRQNPGRIRAAVLDGVVTMDQPQWTTIAQTFLDALSALFNDIAQDAAANLLYPDFGGVFFDFVAGLDPEDQEDFFERGVFGAMNRSRLGYVENIPAVVWRAARGESAALDELQAVRLLIPDPPPDAPISVNMYCAVLRQDMLPFESMTDAAALTNSIPFPLNRIGHAYSKDQYDWSEDWAFLTPTDASFRTPVTNEVPVLILNGTYDTQTGLGGARHVAEHLPNSHYVELPFIGHVVLFGGDVPAQIARDFLVDPWQAPDTSGLTNISLAFPAPWPADAEVLTAGDSLSGAISKPGVAHWIELAAPVPDAPLGVVADVHYQLRLVHLPDPFLVRIYDAADGSRVVQHRGPGILDFVSDGSPLVLAIQPASFGEQTGDYEIEFSVPLLVRQLEIAPPNVGIVWQGPTGVPVAIQAAGHLAATNTFVTVAESPPGPDLLRQEILPAENHPARFFRLVEP